MYIFYVYFLSPKYIFETVICHYHCHLLRKVLRLKQHYFLTSVTNLADYFIQIFVVSFYVICHYIRRILLLRNTGELLNKNKKKENPKNWQ